MKFYCGIDLSARDCHVCVIDEQLKIVVQQKLRNDLAKVCRLGSLVQCTHSENSGWAWQADPGLLVPSTRLLTRVRTPRGVRMLCSA